MNKQSPETEIEVLKVQTKTLHTDLAEMKNDLKVIKEMLVSRFVTKEEFRNFQDDAERQILEAKKLGIVKAIMTSVLTAIIVGIVMFEIGKTFK